jgi:hypothetical protein
MIYSAKIFNLRLISYFVLLQSIITSSCFNCGKYFYKFGPYRKMDEHPSQLLHPESQTLTRGTAPVAGSNTNEDGTTSEPQPPLEKERTRVSLSSASSSSLLEPSSKRMKLLATIRDFSLSKGVFQVDTETTSPNEDAFYKIQQYTTSMNERVSIMEQFTKDEIMTIVQSLQNVIPVLDATTSSTTSAPVTRTSLDAMLQEIRDSYLPLHAHLSHKNWTMTGKNAVRLNQLLFPENDTASDPVPSLLQRHMFERIYREGNWDNAVAARVKATTKPWAVLVTVRTVHNAAYTMKRTRISELFACKNISTPFCVF